jgi:type I restriction enzyme, R subunit
MGMSEADTRVKLVDPKLHDAGWGEAVIEREYPYKRGRIRLIGEQTTRDDPQYVDYLLRDQPHGLPLAVVEAKDEDHSAGAGLQQAMAYAADLDVSFAYSSNGHGVVEHDFLSGKQSALANFPTPNELADRLEFARASGCQQQRKDGH